jgi:hypothetical protein
MLFYFILFCFILFCFTLFFILFYFILFYFILLSEFVGWCTECKNMDGMSNIKQTEAMFAKRNTEARSCNHCYTI